MIVHEIREESFTQDTKPIGHVLTLMALTSHGSTRHLPERAPKRARLLP